MDVKVVTGANYGDEGKGMVAYALAKEARRYNKNVLSILYNGGVQRAHTANGQIIHCTGTGNICGGDTYYDEKFLLDPIALWLTDTRVFINPNCRVVLPCDVILNRKREISRGTQKHGSCGMGIYQCVKRNRFGFELKAKDLREKDPFELYSFVQQMYKKFSSDCEDEVYNTDNFMRAVTFIINECSIVELKELVLNYDTLIFEGGQGLLLDQANGKDFPHLTPSSVGSYNIHNTISNLGADSTEVFYVSRSYMTRHGAGPMEDECRKEDINPSIIDTTNIPNKWQDILRFGFLKTDSLLCRIKGDFNRYGDNVKANLVFTQLNYTNGKLATGEGVFEEISKPDFVTNIYLSDQKDVIEKV